MIINNIDFGFSGTHEISLFIINRKSKERNATKGHSSKKKNPLKMAKELLYINNKNEASRWQTKQIHRTLPTW